MESTEKDWVVEETGRGDFGDKRLTKRFGNLLDIFATCPTQGIPQACRSWKETIAAYRFFSHPNVTPEKILSPHQEATWNRIEREPVVLVVQDSSEIDYSHRQSIEGMGTLRGEQTQGFYIHPSLAITPERVCLGVLDVKMWRRTRRTDEMTASEEKPKESDRWLRGYEIAEEVAQRCCDSLVVNVADRAYRV